ncbi:hypothetical protein, partial [Thermocladium modestius]|uniref:hypothetical protein n=1 Tax=Thermocladium modestius TaxID=62609 RepID=UPI00166BC62F
MRRGYLLYALAAAIATLAVALLASGALAPSLTVETYVHGKPVNAEVQVLALLPPGSPDPIVEAWNGTSSNGAAEVPLSALYGVARRWAAEGFGDTRVGIEVIITYTNGSTAWYGMHFTTYEPNAVIGEEENPVNAVAAAVGGGWRMVTQANDSITIEPRG